MEYKITDYTKKYHSIMVFDKNKNVLVHRWYPFVEGYSKEFIEDILSELPTPPTCALEPFCGSGTTPVELQNHGIRCYSFEVSPFMHLLAKVKLERSYNETELKYYRNKVGGALESSVAAIRSVESIPFGETVIKKYGKKKYNYHDTSLDGLLDIRHAIRTEVDDDRYKNLFTIALASIVLQTSNMFRNGKCLSYKDGWENRIVSRDDVHTLFLNKLDTVIAEDVKILARQCSEVKNSDLCYYGDVRTNIEKVPDKSLDLIITSPPYLNSRDYTDIYMLELKVLELVHNYEDLRQLRKSTIRSHVQVNYSDIKPINNSRLRACLADMNESKTKSWNPNILKMICGYFEDMQKLFVSFEKKMRSGGVIYFNVANSSYFGVEVPVDYIIGDIAEDCGFRVREIRKARDLKTSPQQSGHIGKLRESVLVIDKIQ
jgi:DNA modification methylase